MRVTSLKRLAALLLLGAILLYSAPAEAHGVRSQSSQAVSQDHEAPIVADGESALVIVSNISGSEDGGCAEGCCTMMAFCCPTAALIPLPFEFVPQTLPFEFDYRTKALVSSQPYDLLRPPKRIV